MIQRYDLIGFSIADWHKFYLGFHYSDATGEDLTSWLEDNIPCDDYILWYTPSIAEGGGDFFYISIKEAEYAMAYKLKWD